MNAITVEAVLPAQLYEVYDASGVLLYVGVATNLASRLSSHKTDKPWWGEVVRVAATTYSTKAAAIEAEQILIRERKPKYNVTHSDRNNPKPSVRRESIVRKGGAGYRANVTRKGKWWMVSIPELDGLTQARRISEAEDMARDWLALTLGVAVEDVKVKVEVEDVSGIDVAGALASIDATRHEADTLRASALEQAEALAKKLAAKDIPVRDIGTILGVSFQRAHQLVTGSK